MNRISGLLMTFLAACSYGASAIVIKLAYSSGLQPATLLTWQNLVALLFLWPLLFFSCGWNKISRRHCRQLLLLGLGGNLGISVCYFWAAQRIDVSLLSIILFTYPGLVLLYQMVAEKRRVMMGEWLALIMALIGAVLAVDPFQQAFMNLDGVGLLLAAGGAISYAFMNVYGGKLTHEIPTPVITAITGSVSTVGVVTLLPPDQGLTTLSIEQGLLIAASGILSMVLPMNLMYLGIRRIGVFYASVISIAELPCILFLAYLILQERLTSLQLFGAILILSSVILLQCVGANQQETAATNGC